MSHDPFKASKREWKRYDPDPPEDENEHGCDRCEWRTWEKAVWCYTLIAAIILAAYILSNVTGGS